ncbi:MAG: RDD family protein, partial [Candidatus Hodarchaeota archaeon]
DVQGAVALQPILNNPGQYQAKELGTIHPPMDLATGYSDMIIIDDTGEVVYETGYTESPSMVLSNWDFKKKSRKTADDSNLDNAILLLEMEFIYATKVNLEPFITFDPDFKFYRMMILSQLVYLSDPSIFMPDYQFALYSFLIFGLIFGPAFLDSLFWTGLIESLVWLLGYGFIFTVHLTIILAYYSILEGYHGRTLGKFLLGLRVVSETGVRATWQQILTRNLSKFNLTALMLDWLAGGLLKKNRQRGLDVLAKTQVIVSF